MRYNYKEIDDSVADVFRLKYHDYLEFLEHPYQKLAFVKQLKEDSGLGLKESKEVADIIFSDNVTTPVELFKSTFGINIKQIRREKLDALKKRLLINELIEYIKKSDDSKLEEVLSLLDIDTIEIVLNPFLDD